MIQRNEKGQFIKGNKLSPVHIRKLRESRVGKKHTEETKKKISEANKGKRTGEGNPSKRMDVRKKLSNAAKKRTGKTHSCWKGGCTAYYHKKARDLLQVTDPNLNVHHIDGDPRNNDITNLRIMTHLEHSKLHIYEKLEKMIAARKKVGNK